MPRRTREEKIIADLRRELQVKNGTFSITPKVVSELTQEISTESADGEKTAEEYSYIKRDLLKVLSIVTLVVIFEIIGSFIFNSGALKQFGIT